MRSEDYRKCLRLNLSLFSNISLSLNKLPIVMINNLLTGIANCENYLDSDSRRNVASVPPTLIA